jgi:hypothetical protein
MPPVTENKIGYISYGSFLFPSNFTHSVNCRPWYGADDVTAKGIECLLSVEFVLYENAYKDNLTIEELPSLNEQINTARQNLLTPRKNLTIRGTGWAFKEYTGDQSVPSPNLRFPDVILGADQYFNNSFGGEIDKSTVLGDLNNGPLPQEFIVEPIVGANAVKCVWKCLFWFNYCTGVSTSLSPDDVSQNQPLEFNYETSYTFQKNGRLKYTLAGTYSFYSYSYRTADPQTNTIAVRATVNERVQLRPVFYEPFVPDGFQVVNRSIEFNNTQDKATFRFDIEEINSNNPYFPYVVSMDARHQASSSIYNKDNSRGAGFSTWGNKLDVTVELMPHIHPRYAYEVFLMILMTRTKTPIDASAIASGMFGSLFQGLPWPFPDYVKRTMAVTKTGTIVIKSLTVTEGIYSNTHTFSAEWMAACPLRLLAFSSGLFKYQGNRPDAWKDPNNDSASQFLKEDRKRYNDTNENFTLGLPATQEIGGQIAPSRLSSSYILLGNPKIPALFFDPCLGSQDRPDYLSSPPTNQARQGFGPQATLPVNRFIPSDLFNIYDQFKPQQSEDQPIDPQNTFLSYNVSFEIEEDTRAYQIPINSGDALNQTPLLSRKIHTPQQAQLTGPTDTSGSMNANYGSLAIGTPGDVPVANGSVIVAGGENTYKVVMRGSAARILYPISCPSVVSVGGQIAVRAPGGKFVQRQVSSSTVPLYRAEWEITYMVVGPLSNPHQQLLFDESFAVTNARSNDYVAGRKFDGTGPTDGPFI